MKLRSALEAVTVPDIGSRSPNVTLSLDISLRDFPYSKVTEDAVIKQASNLARSQAEIVRCRVKLIQLPRQQTLIQFVRVHIDVMTRHDYHLSGHVAGEDARATLCEAFREVEFALRREIVRGQSKATIGAKGGM